MSLSSIHTWARGERLDTLAAMLAQLNRRIRAESADSATAVALRERFGPALPSIGETRTLILAQLGRGRAPDQTLLTLYGALGDLSDILTATLPAADIVPLSRPAARKAQQRAERLEASAQKMLAAVGKALAAGAAVTAASALMATPAAAGCSTTGTTTICDGDLGGGVSTGWPLTDDLTIHNLTTDILPVASPGVRLVSGGANGGGGGAWSDGDDGSDAPSLAVSVTDPDNSIVVDSGAGVFVYSIGGRGGGGGGAGLGGSGGDGGWGGAGGDIQATIAIDIETTGDSVHGIMALSAGGKGGGGGDFSFGFGSAGDGGQGGAGGAVSVLFGANSIVTSGVGADGVFASSVGGNGGAAGDCDVAICGSSGGGNSAIGGTVSVTTVDGSSITTHGAFSKGIRASSIGGFGGDGGDSYFAAGFASNGGSAGDGGAVYVSNGGAISTWGVNGDAIFAQSVGGGGGDGGDSGVSLFSLGGGGAQGGSGGYVEVINEATGLIETWGAFARGIYAQSVGGGGGAGGSASSLVSIGGNGSGTSNGGSVHVSNAGSIITHGGGSQAIFAQSIGGGGGDGGGAGGLAAVGGTGGSGGDSSGVSVANSGHLGTSGADAAAIYAQSIGGGGGDGASAGGMVSIGGAGGAGGDSGVVTVSNSGSIRTSGDRSNGIFAQSVGGGGGNGGGAASFGAFLNISVGGSGGNGGDGAAVDVAATDTSDIRTGGERAAAIFAQSVGGGGGNGGYGAGAAIGAFGALSIGVGGTGGDGGDGANVTVNTDGYLETFGADSQGVFAQSVGGGGGNGGFAVAAALAAGQVAVSGSVAVGGAGGGAGDGATVSVLNRADISTTGDRSSGLHAQSIGGGGGNGGWSGAIAGAGGAVAGAISVSVGGTAGGGGDGGVVDVGNFGDIHTRGVDAYGVLAQSIGGGGGTGGFSVSGAVGGGKVAGGLSLSLGGQGGLGGDGGDVEVVSEGLILTEGDRSSGILAQSLGGGGGAGGWSGGLAVGAGGAGGGGSVTVGGLGAAGGDGWTVDVQSDSDIRTQGHDAHGVLAQSVGGGGGAGGFSLGAAVGAGRTGVGAAITVGGGGGAGGDANTVTVVSTGDILTGGDRATGITAQSLGGGGGSGGFTGSIAVGAGSTAAAITVGVGGFGGVGGDGALVTLTSGGDIGTTGVDAQGLFAQSIGGGGGNGGFSAAAGVAAGTNAGAGSLTIGGFGGAAGDGGTVILTNNGSVVTTGDRSHAVQGQSIGGGGGNGGIAASFTAAFSSSTPVSLGLNLGGFGGAGGDAGDVTIVSAEATTHGDGAHAIFGQSVGGGGGAGGFSLSGALSAGGSNNIALNANIGGAGGAGGAAGDAGDVSVTASGMTWTTGDGAHGLFAQSVGGGGGDGGWAGTLSGALGASKSVSLGVTLGGMAGAGGGAGDVTVRSNGQILTEGDASHAVFAQSVGGGGGTGGFTVAANLGATKATNIGLTMGGSGGGAGAAGDVSVTVRETINTRGDGAIGVFAQSIGGGGGAGGSAGSIALSGSQSVNLTANMGGFGGAGATGGAVEVDNSGAIWTLGEMSHGVFAQSVGGGGGQGGLAGIDETGWSDYLAGGSGSVSFGDRSQNISLSLGGSGGAGADGGEVQVGNSGVIVTDGPLSHAIYAQSVGGGGGDGGVATAASGGFGAGKNGTYSVAMGGFGGAAGDGGLVGVLNSGALRTRSDGSAGVFAQSVGGGGGAGGDARGYSMSFSPSKSKGSISVNVSLGGYGGAAGDGGAVDVDNSGQILTDGALSYGVFAQSVGGGGGTGGLVSTAGDEIIWVLDQINKGNVKGGQIAIGGSGGAGGDGGLVTVTNSGLIYTRGQQAHGVFAQSVGGGGGNGGSGLAGEISVGGQGGAAGDGGDVHVVNTGTIVTTADMAKGIVAQSIGGGGGVGGATDYDGDDNYSWRSEVSATMTTVGNLQDTIDLVMSTSQPAFGIGIGGMGGAAGDGGLVTVENHGAIQTSGDFATGIFAQSVGGGGGQGGEGVFTGVGQVIFSGLGGNAGDGGDVIVTNTGDITTSGYGAYGIFAQSVGGGGGLAGDYSLGIASWGDLTVYGGEDYSDLLSLQLNPVHANGGDGGDVTVTNTGDIRVYGDGAVGIFAQSVGGGGGLFGGRLLLGFIGSMEGVGTGGRVTVVQNGDVLVGGKNAIGAVFQSASKDGDQDITATLNGAVKGGSVYGMAVLIDGGLNNTLTLNGIAWADSDLAITATGGNDAVIANKGLIGNVDLGLGVNRLTNTANSFFLSLDYVRLNGGDLVNQGLLTPGDAGTVQRTAVTGSFVQSATGEMLTDLDLLRTGKSGEIDQLALTGSIDIRGEFTLSILNPGYALPGDHTVTILDGSGTLTQSGVVLNKPTSAVASFRLVATSQDLNLNYAIDFSPTGLNGNQTALGDHINAIQLAGSSSTFAPITAELFYVPTVTDLANIYDSFSPQTYGAQQAAQIFAGQQFADSMFSCQRPSAGVRFSESGCVWVKPAARRLELSATSSAMAFDEQSTGLSGGFEAALGGSGWRVGGAVSGEIVDGGVRSRTSADGERFQFGLVAKRDPVAGVGFGLALHGGQSELDTTRLILLPSGPRWAEATQAITFMAATARASYRWGTDQGYLKPMLEVSAVKVETAGFTERGAGALNLVVPDQQDTYSRVSFKVEAGGEFKAGGAVVRPYGRVGVTTSADAREALFTAAFEGAPAAAAAGFSVNPGLDETTVDAEVGIAIVGPWASGRLAWTGQFGDRTDNQTLSVKLAVPF